jgi:16S rRNA (cytidine1402-2'-O)-methyltransferase
MLAEAGRLLGERPILVARELTKIHQEFIRGTAKELSERLSAPRGEFTILVGPTDKRPETNALALTDDEVAHEFWRITENGASSRRQIVSELAKRSGRSAKEVYSVIERVKKLGV